MVAWDLLEKSGHSVYAQCESVVIKTTSVAVKKW